MVLGIESLFDDHDPGEIFSRFKSIEPELSVEQQEAVNNALIEAGYDKVFKPIPVEDSNVGFQFVNLKKRVFSLGILGLDRKIVWEY